MKRIGILGLGLIGGSLALSLKRAWGDAVEVVGYNRTQAVALEAQRVGAIDRAEARLEAAVDGAELVIIAVPVMAMRDIMEAIAGHLEAGTVVSDVSSTKALVTTWAKELLPPQVSFVGGHPMAGREKAGFAAATPDLFHGAIYCLTPSSAAPPEATALLEEVAHAVGARPLWLDAEVHDELVGGISHLPLIAAAALVGTTATHPSWTQMAELAASGFRDTTRLASGDPTMGRDMLISNRHLAGWIDRYIEELNSFRRLLESPQATPLGQKLAAAREVREELRQRKDWP